MDWFLYSAFLLYLYTQSALYNMPQSPNTFSFTIFYLAFLHIHSLMRTSQRNLGFNILSKDTSVCRLEKPGIKTPTFQLADDLHCPCVTVILQMLKRRCLWKIGSEEPVGHKFPYLRYVVLKDTP